MRRISPTLAVCVALTGCTSLSERGPVASAEPADRTLAAAPSSAAIGGWTVRVSVNPFDLSPIDISVRAARRAPANDARPWIQHDLVFENNGDRPVRFADTRTSAFIGSSGHRMLLAADEGCGYAPETGKSRIEAGVCAAYLDAFVVKPHASVSRTVTLFKGLPGMAPLAEGTYVFEKPMRFRIGAEIRDQGTGRSVLLPLVYEVEAAAARR